jgi:hypothetical protein
VARVNRKWQLSTRERMQLTLWGGVLFIILLGLVYFLVRNGAIVPISNGVAHQGGGGIHENAPDSRP